jgi:NAD(P)H-dependent flavin oxidoreductase YrpB (nitropropane dioxygenase family)
MLHTRLCDILSITYPVVQAGMARSYTNADLVAAVSAAGGLGVLGCLGRPADEALAEIRRIRALTDRPFSVNFVLHLCIEETFEACLAERVPIFSFFRGEPAEAIARAHAIGATTICQITTVEEAVRACEAGADVLVAQGYEAGGHMGPIPLLALLPEVVAVAGERPVLAAGGIVDGRGLAAVLCLGASGVLMGTRFLATPEAPAQAAHKQAILAARTGDILASDIFDILWGDEWPGVQTRAIQNQFTKRWVGREDELQAGIEEIRQQRAQTSADQNPDEMPLLSGAGAGLIRELKPAGQIVREVVEQAQQILRTWGGRVG